MFNLVDTFITHNYFNPYPAELGFNLFLKTLDPDQLGSACKG